MRHVPLALSAAAVLAFAASAAFAQSKPAPTAAASQGAPPSATPAPSAPAATTAAAPQASGQAAAAPDAPPKPPAIVVDDPLLAPIAPAPKTLTSFREVLSLLSNQSTAQKIATLEIERAKGNKRQVLAAALPDVNGQASVSTSYGGVEFSTPVAQAQLTVSQPILAPRAWHAIGTAEKQIEGAKLNAEDTRRTAITSAATFIVAVVTAERVAEINRVGLRSALERLELTKRKKRLGSGTDLDIVRAEQDATSARGTLVSGDENLRKAREQLGQVFNSSDAYGVPASFSINDIEQALKSACRPEKPENRADVLVAKNDLAIAERGVTDVKLAYAPTASVSSTLAVTSNTNVLNPNAGSWSISAVLSIPIWDGGARYGQAKIASVQVEEAKLRVQDATVGASIEGTQAQRAVTVADQSRAISERTRDLARETARLSQIAFESGAGTSLDLVDSGRTLRQAELDLALKELEVVRAKIAALLALSACTL